MHTFPKQQLAIDTRVKHTLYCGSRKAGKTLAQLMCWKKMVHQHWDKKIRGLIFDTGYDPLNDIIGKSQELFAKFNDGARYTQHRWRYPNGSELLFRAAKNMGEASKFLGWSNQFLGMNELTKQADPEVYDRLAATLEPPEGLQAIIFSTTNPFEAGKMWVKQRWMNVPYGHIQTTYQEIANGQKVPIKRVAIFGSFTENPYLTPEAIAEIYDACRNNPALYKAWIEGSWDSTIGGAFDGAWDRDVHVLPMTNETIEPIPSDWRVDRGFDWGAGSPASVLWFAEVTDDSEYCGRSYERGTIIVFYEWYIATDKGKGAGLTPQQICEGILDREHYMRTNGLVDKRCEVLPGPADTQIWNDERPGIMSIAREMSGYGVDWDKAYKGKNSRSQGKQAIRTRLINKTLFFVGCHVPKLVEHLPALQNDQIRLEDIATGQPDHDYDVLRYRLLQDSIYDGDPILGKLEF